MAAQRMAGSKRNWLPGHPSPVVCEHSSDNSTFLGLATTYMMMTMNVSVYFCVGGVYVCKNGGLFKASNAAAADRICWNHLGNHLNNIFLLDLLGVTQ